MVPSKFDWSLALNNVELGSSSSLHDQVREELMRRIRKGTYKPGDLIPSTAALSEEFSVSPITVKRALRDLRGLGELTAVAGKGTFVKGKQRFVLALDAGISPWKDANLKLLSITREKITDPTLDIFGPPDRTMLCVRKMIYFDDDVAVMYDATYLSSDVDEEIIEEFGESLVADALKRHSIDILNTSHVVDAAPADGRVAEIFGVPNGYPMLRRLYRVTTADPDITIYGVVQSPFDRVACSVDVAPARPQSGGPRRKRAQA